MFIFVNPMGSLFTNGHPEAASIADMYMKLLIYMAIHLGVMVPNIWSVFTAATPVSVDPKLKVEFYRPHVNFPTNVRRVSSLSSGVSCKFSYHHDIHSIVLCIVMVSVS